MPTSPRAEVEAAHDRYVATRARIEAGELGWDALADFFTEDATFVDPAWGRIEGRERIRRFMVESMAGLEDWTFPHLWRVVEGDRIVAAWQNRLPGARPDGSPYQALGISVIRYAGDGRFSSEEDVLNMVHVFELMQESGWQPNDRLHAPPKHPRR
jgi:ketosteroid isomerase-like protein